ncbi:hypothetical protein ACHQM5_022635 [Ranunculus cassubicifolius]
MAENPDQNQEKNIPVFTVYKKGIIFKNIFLLDKTISPPPPSLISNPNFIKSLENQNPRGSDDFVEDDEEILLVGRHPDCNIVLEHPSISRFHLRIHLHPSLQKLFIIDLGSAHGTWISDQKIEPHVPVELSEGDTLKLAVSTRSYRLHWFPLSRAFDVENPPVPPNFVNLLPLEEEEEEEEESENLSTFEKNPSPSAPPMPESMEVAVFDNVEEQAHSSFSFCTTEENHDPNVVLGHTFASEPVSFSLSLVKCTLSETLEQQIDKENQDNSPSSFAEFVQSIEVKQESQLSGLQKESDTPSLWSRRGKPASLIRVQTALSKVENMDAGDQGELLPKALFPCSDVEEVFTPGKENYTPTSELGSKSGKKGSIRKLDSLIRIQTASSKVENMDTADQGELSPKVLFPCSDVEEVFTPGKENYTPTSEPGTKSGKKGSRRKLEHQRSCGSTLSQREPRSGSRLRRESDMITSSRRAGREPFQTLVVNSFSNSEPHVSVPITKTTTINSITYDQKIEAKAPLSSATRRWYMVADTNSLLNKESRKSLQLLYGLKGTRLIIPRTVRRELESLKRQGSLFGSVSEASFALQWIEKCLVETKNWIHVQDSTEENIPPTPPASPRWSSQLSEGINKVFGKQVPSFSWSSLLPEIITPTAQDCILDSALFFKNKKKDGQVVLLSNDVSLKIKAMAEGVLCESAEEFRASLVDPYSERFLWAGSTPRGPTWSCLDEAGPREKFGYVPVKNGACKEANSAKKGLKLILRDNYSHYGQLASVR